MTPYEKFALMFTMALVIALYVILLTKGII